MTRGQMAAAAIIIIALALLLAGIEPAASPDDWRQT